MTCRAVWLSLLVLLLLPLLLMMVMLRGLWLVVAALLMLWLVMVIMLLLLMVLPAAPLVIAMLLTPIAPPATLRPTSASASSAAACWPPSLQAHLISTPRAQRTARRVDRAFITAIQYCARGSCNNITVPIPSSCAQGGSPRIRCAIKRGNRRGTVQINAAPLAAL